MNPAEYADDISGTTTRTDQQPAASPRQERFLRGMLGVLVDVTILALFVEHWDRFVIDSYTIALLTAILLQVARWVTADFSGGRNSVRSWRSVRSFVCARRRSRSPTRIGSGRWWGVACR